MAVSAPDLPRWTVIPFPALVLAIAVLPMVVPRAWERRRFQILVVSALAVPLLVHLAAAAKTAELLEAATSYVSFVTTLAALYVTSGGIVLAADVEATPTTNVAIVLLGATLAILIGTTGASMLMIRPLLWTNRQREHRAHLVPFFIVAVANAGGLLTPLGDPPLLVGYIGGVPFFWTLRLLPAWLLYVGSSALVLYWVDRRAYARESGAPTARDRAAAVRFTVRGRRNVALMLAVVPAALLPAGMREIVMLAITAASLWLTPRALHRDTGFSSGPILDVAVIFAGLFACLGPIRTALAASAPWFPFRRAWQLFWATGRASAVLDNAPTYSAFAALARGLSRGTGLVAGVSVHKLAAVSIGSVVMGATTYIGNGPNLMVKAIADRERFPTPSFFRYALFAFAVMLPAHIVTTFALAYLERGIPARSDAGAAERAHVSRSQDPSFSAGSSGREPHRDRRLPLCPRRPPPGPERVGGPAQRRALCPPDVRAITSLLQDDRTALHEGTSAEASQTSLARRTPPRTSQRCATCFIGGNRPRTARGPP